MLQYLYKDLVASRGAVAPWSSTTALDRITIMVVVLTTVAHFDA